MTSFPIDEHGPYWIFNYSLARGGGIKVDVVMGKPVVLNDQGEIIMSSSQWNDGAYTYVYGGSIYPITSGQTASPPSP